MKKKSLLITAIAIFGFAIVSMAQTVPSYVPTSGLVGWWPFTGNANDSSGNGNNGTVYGATLTADRFGNVNAAYNFDGISNNIAISSLNNLQYNPISYSFWFNASTLCDSSSNDCWRMMLGRDQFGNLNQGQFTTLNHSLNGTYNRLMYYTGGNDSRPDITPLINFWYHVVFTYDNTNTTNWYINGAHVSTGNLVANSNANIPFYIGSGGNRYYFNGLIDDIGIWNRALDSCEIKDLYFASLGNCCHISISTQPVSQSASISNNVQFTTSSDSSATYQWQTDLGVGFQNINSVGQYSGTNKDTLRVANVTMGNNNQPFRCIVSSGACSDTSDAAVLTVINANGINETSANNLFTVYPNPAKSQINVKADATLIGSSYTVYNNIGKVTLTGKINAENTVLDLGHLSSGVYLFSIGDSLKQRFTVVK